MMQNNNFTKVSTNKKNFFNIGKITRTHALIGEVFVSLMFADTKKIPSLITSQCAQIYTNTGNNFCFETKIHRARLHKQGMIIKLEGVDSYYQAEQLKQKNLFVPKKLFISHKDEEIYLCEVLDFIVKDKVRGGLGQIYAFSTNGAQDLLLVQNTKGREIEIPFIKEFIKDINFTLKKIEVDLPFNWPNLEDKEIQQ